MFNKVEAIEAMETAELSEDNKGFILGQFSNIFELNKSVEVEEIEDFDSLEVSDTFQVILM